MTPPDQRKHIWEVQHFGPQGGSYICIRCFRRKPWWQFWTGRCPDV